MIESSIRTSQQIPALFLPISGLLEVSNQKNTQNIILNIQNNIQDILNQDNDQGDKISEKTQIPSIVKKKVKRKKTMSSHDRVRYKKKI